MVRAIRAGGFDGDVWTAAEQRASALSFEGTLAAVEAQKETYAM